MQIDLNCDMGESFGAYTLGRDEEIIASVSSVSIACGFHAGDPGVMRRTVRLAREHGVAVGAHPGLPDLLGFGRRDMACSPEEVADYLTYQIGALQAFCTAQGVALRHVKPHGALYNRAAGDGQLVRAMAQAIARIDRDLLLVGLAGQDNSRMEALAAEEGIAMVFEAFPDRAYTPEGTLVPRHLPGAVIHDPATAAVRALRTVTEGVVEAIDGRLVPLVAQTLCIHGDNPQGVALAAAIRAHLQAAGIAVRPMRPA
ncbi:LamB/YcsF family protein [Desulfobulbus elongatus]|uniref:LamB/YcsF family protein n=1 Tax=Desulfobulbus elongatus TaxID=53332 RepID=UPI0004820A88|nr:5-oxoprolinase subunit PxpA [Desulfobulbus elongatus]